MSLTKNVSFDLLTLSGNVRTEACTRIPEMVESLRRVGYKDNHPLVVSLKENGDHLVLCGNRRTGGLGWLYESDRPAFDRALPTGKVPCIVHKGLTIEEEVLLRIDHGTEEDRVPLDEWSQYRAIKQLVTIGVETQEQIADKLGIFILKGKKKGQPNRSYVQPRVNLARLPQYVEEAMQERSEGSKTATIRWADIPGLYKVYNEEFATYPDGDGPDFTQLWESVVNPQATAKPTDIKEKPLSVADATKRAQATSSVGLRDALLCVTGQGKDLDFVSIDARLVEAETALQVVERIALFLGEEKFQTLLTESAEYAAMQAEPVAA